MDNRDSFIFYRSFFEATKPLKKNEKAELFDAICNYALDQKQCELKPFAKAMFALIQPQLDANYKKYLNGKKPKEKTSKPEASDKQTVSKTEGNVNANDNVNVNENNNVNDTKKEKKAASPVFVFRTSLIDYGFKKELVDDWLKVRKNKKATNTVTAFNSFITEIEKTGKDKNEIFKTIVESGWSSFKNSWLEKNIGPPDNGRYIKRDITDFEYE
jgi:hypothetical protein